MSTSHKREAPRGDSRRCVLVAEKGSGEGCLGYLDLVVPGVRGFERLVDVLDVFDAGRVEPIFKGLGALLRVDGDAVLPGGAAAEHAIEGRSTLRCEF